MDGNRTIYRILLVPQITFFKVVYRETTKLFKWRLIEQTFNGNVAANQRVSATITTYCTSVILFTECTWSTTRAWPTTSTLIPTNAEDLLRITLMIPPLINHPVTPAWFTLNLLTMLN